jgi:hypothetical protein
MDELKSNLTVEYVNSLLDYNKETGVFTWNKIAGNRLDRVGKIAGTKHPLGYRQILIGKKLYQEHLLAWFVTYGEFPNEYIDHINHTRDDNRIENLRVVTRTENHKNKSIYKTSTTNVHGVNWYKQTNRWKAVIVVDSKKIHLGYFTDFSEAVEARKQAEIKYKFHENHGRKVA